MSITNEIAAFGTLLKRGDGATPEVFTTIAEVGDIAGPTLKTNMEDATNHSSTGAFEEKIPTTKSLGQIKFPVNFRHSDATHNYAAGLVSDWNNKTRRNLQMVYPEGTTWTFACYVTGIDFKQPVKGGQTADVTLDITGSPTLA